MNIVVAADGVDATPVTHKGSSSSVRAILAHTGGKLGGCSSEQVPMVEIVRTPLSSVKTDGSSLAATILREGMDPGPARTTKHQREKER